MQQGALNFVNSLVGTISGYNPFPAASGGAVPQTIVNRCGTAPPLAAGNGLGAWLYGMLPVKQLPQKSKAKTLGKSLLTGGVLGGLFSTGNPHNTNLISSSPALTVSSSEVSYT